MTAAVGNGSAAYQTDALQLACFLENLKAVLDQGKEIHARLVGRLEPGHDAAKGSSPNPAVQHFHLAEEPEPGQWAKAPPPPLVESAEPARKPMMKAAPPGLAQVTAAAVPQVKARPTSKAPPPKAKAPPAGYRIAEDELGADTAGGEATREPREHGKAPPPELSTEAAAPGAKGTSADRTENPAKAKAPPACVVAPVEKAPPAELQEPRPPSPDRGGGGKATSASAQAFSKAPPPPLLTEPQEERSPEARPVAKEGAALSPPVKQPAVKAPPPPFVEEAQQQPSGKAPPPFLVEESPPSPPVKQQTKAKAPPAFLAEGPSSSPPVKQPAAKAPPPPLLEEESPPAKQLATKAPPPLLEAADEPANPPVKQPAAKAPPPFLAEEERPSQPGPPAKQPPVKEPAASPPVKQPAAKAPPPFLAEESPPAGSSPAEQPPMNEATPAAETSSAEEPAAAKDERPPSPPVKQPAAKAPPPFLAEEKPPANASPAEQPPAKEGTPAAETSRSPEEPPAAKDERPPSPPVKQPAAKAPPPFLAAACLDGKRKGHQLTSLPQSNRRRRRGRLLRRLAVQQRSRLTVHVTQPLVLKEGEVGHSAEELPAAQALAPSSPVLAILSVFVSVKRRLLSVFTGQDAWQLCIRCSRWATPGDADKLRSTTTDSHPEGEREYGDVLLQGLPAHKIELKSLLRVPRKRSVRPKIDLTDSNQDIPVTPLLSTAMGNMGSYNMSCPPGGTVIALQDPQECFSGKPTWKETSKPQTLAALPETVWKDFAGKVSDACNRCWDERLPFCGLIFIIFPFVNAFSNITSSSNSDSVGINLGMVISSFCMLLAFLTILGGRFAISNRNQSQDMVIRMACQQLVSSSQGAFAAEYRTMWTGHCRPKGARVMRVIVISPATGSAAAYAQPIMVTVPQGATAGATLQVQTPSGLQSVTVPPGVAPGQTFSFTPTPAVVAPPVVVVQAQVVGGAPLGGTVDAAPMA
ncbi:unc-89 [Symbiodinium natans]|uniref:Unc-89 protein n=1 Tax=Symbiodinium natans TaxID=878477 RepID=A0A812RCS8_9DINO|nr:unc-89 [Symbiodinium natans]